MGLGPAPPHDSVFRIIYAGGLSLQKGVAYLLEAFTKLRLPNSELLLVGNEYPEARAFLVPYAGAYRHVRFVRQSELPALYQQGSVFVLPSLQDGFGMVVYEAAACGLPVITTDHVGASLRDGIDGFVVPIRNADVLAERILHLYSQPAERAAMAASAQQYVQQFTWAQYHRELCGLYARLTGSN
jgi:glycosyltransferase involved in cell wall biosynthesis